MTNTNTNTNTSTNTSTDTDAVSVHGHDVIHLIHHAEPALTRASLAREVAARFGEQARFHTCSARGMTLGQLLQFLEAREKVVERDGRLYVLLGNVCSHGDEDGHYHDHE